MSISKFRRELREVDAKIESYKKKKLALIAGLEALIAKGVEQNHPHLEWRRGHKVKGWRPETAEDGREYLYIIVKKELPPIDEIFEGPFSITIQFADGKVVSKDTEDIVLGSGETAVKAWLCLDGGVKDEFK